MIKMICSIQMRMSDKNDNLFAALPFGRYYLNMKAKALETNNLLKMNLGENIFKLIFFNIYIMAQKGNLKLVDKYQFNEKKFITIEGIDWFEAIHIETKQAYTLKRVCLSGQAEREQPQKIMNQLTILKKLNNPLIPKCHKLFKTSNNMYLIYDKISGVTLEQFIKENAKNMDWQSYKTVCLKVSEELLRLLVYLKDKKICHSYINFNSIFMGSHNITKVINYSYAQELPNQEGKYEQVHKNMVIDQFSAPQLKNGLISAKTDIYSAGAILLKLFALLKHMAEHSHEEQGIIQIQNILQFCKKMVASELQERIDAQQAYKYFENRLYQKQAEDNSRKLLLMTDPGVTAARSHTLDQSPKNFSRFHSPIIKKNQLSLMGSQTQQYFHIARKVLNKRNMSELLLQLSQFCAKMPLCSSEKSNPLVFLMLKKSALIVSQLARFLETGRGQGLRMEDRTRDKLKKHKLFVNLEKNIHKQMQSMKEKLQISMQYISENIQNLQNNPQLEKELAIEQVDNDYLRKCVAAFQDEVLAWQKERRQKVDNKIKLSTLLQKKQLILFFVLTLLTEYTTLQQIFDFILSDSGCSLWNQSFFIQSLKLSQEQLEGLILLQGQITYPKHIDNLNVSSRQITNSRKNL